MSFLGRTTRCVTLTKEGSRYCRQILLLEEQAREEAKICRVVTCQRHWHIRRHLASCMSRMIFAFQDRHQDVWIDLNFTDQSIDLACDGVTSRRGLAVTFFDAGSFTGKS
ncbi:hypothetical protein [Agrobacterium bohemicum]|uniref:HTH lysR-type domain-containing protein n=1 Tax=Agrobacterium bohemicum TaxID=2052828 RepID=A0A135P7I4_9HYPH|nr:hypothetical protein [Agrobacterium bohemicum]KXG87318.1 hypothetical protein ATO67_20145 [Agrobacterium bohemicum]